ncbi:RNA chaperone Hfq [Clostridium sp. DL1XJH146]
MNKSATNLQDVFLNNARKNLVSVTVYLTNGFQLKGVVKGFDNFIIMLQVDDKQMMIYKHAVSTITPSKPILYQVNSRNENNSR